MKFYLNNFFKAELIFPLFLLIIFSVLLVEVSGYPSHPRQLPMAIISITLCLLVVEVGMNLLAKVKQLSTNPKQGEEELSAGTRKVIWSVISFPIFLGGAVFIGFLTTVFFYIMGLGWIFGYRQKKALFLTALITSFLMFLIFKKALGVPLPSGIII